MTHPIIRRTVRLALPAAALLGAAALGAVWAQAPAPATQITQLRKQALDIPGREVLMLTLDVPPGPGSAAHRHPGQHVFGYVLEGAYRTRLDDGAETVVNKGETFYEAPGQLHAVSRSASDAAPAKVLVVIVAESGKPVTVPEPR